MKSQVKPRLLVLAIAAIGWAASMTSAMARGGGAANLLNSPGYQRAQKDARDNYLRQYYGQQQVVVMRRKHRRHPH